MALFCLLTACGGAQVIAASSTPEGQAATSPASPPPPRSLADFALTGPQANAAPEGAQHGPVLRILYNASTKGTLHPCPS